MFSVNETVVYRKNLFRIAEIRNPNSKMDCMYLLVPCVDDGSLRIQVPATKKWDIFENSVAGKTLTV